LTVTAHDLGVPDAALYYAMVAEHVADTSIWDDCIQEAAIHVWKLQQRGVEQTPAYYHKAARRRIKEVATRQTWTGHSGRHGKAVDPLRRPHDSLDLMRETTRNQEEML
jgi:hypothetical protein